MTSQKLSLTDHQDEDISAGSQKPESGSPEEDGSECPSQGSKYSREEAKNNKEKDSLSAPQHELGLADEKQNAVEPVEGTSSRPGEEQSKDMENALAGPSTSRELYSVFTKRQKYLIVFIASLAGFFSPLSASIYFPALNTLATDLRVSSELINLSLTTYMIFQGIAPTLVGDMADMLGRRPVYIACFSLYILANIGLALQRNYAALMVLRCLQSSGSSGTIALALAVVADISTSSERGTYIGYASLGFMAGPAFGPVFGGALSQYLGWPSIFWFLTIAAGITLIFIMILLPETGRNVVGNGSVPPPNYSMSVMNYVALRRSRGGEKNLAHSRAVEEANNARLRLADARKLRFPNPLAAIHIILQKDVGLILFYNSLFYSAFYCVISTIAVLYAQIYGFNNLQIGLCFIPFGVGAGLASVVNGKLMDWNFRRVAAQHNITIDRKRAHDIRNFPIEKARLQVALPMLYTATMLFIAYGWFLEFRIHYAAPIVCLFFLGVFVNSTFSNATAMLVDYYPQSPATATSANNLVRCLMGAAATALIVPLMDAMGIGWSFTFIAFVLLALSPILFVVRKYGPKWREQRHLKQEKETKRRNCGDRLRGEAQKR